MRVIIAGSREGFEYEDVRRAYFDANKAKFELTKLKFPSGNWVEWVELNKDMMGNWVLNQPEGVK